MFQGQSCAHRGASAGRDGSGTVSRAVSMDCGRIMTVTRDRLFSHRDEVGGAISHAINTYETLSPLEGREHQPTVPKEGTHLRRDTVIPQWFQASKAAAASDGHAVHC
jgi:hypothetical protein